MRFLSFLLFLNLIAAPCYLQAQQPPAAAKTQSAATANAEDTDFILDKSGPKPSYKRQHASREDIRKAADINMRARLEDAKKEAAAKKEPAAKKVMLPDGNFVSNEILPLEMPKNVTLAEPFTLTYRLPQDIKIKETRLDDFEVLGVAPNKEYADAVDITLMPFNLQKVQFPGIEVILPDGTETATTPFEIEIGPAKIKLKAEGLIDIRSPYRPFNWWIVVFVIIGIAIIIGLLRYFSYRAGNKKVERQNPYGNDARPLHIIALDRLNMLLMQDYWENKQYKVFYTDMIDIFRDYLTARFKFDAHMYTSRDLLKKLKSMPDFKADIRQVDKLQKSADLVKFAKLSPDTVERDSDVNNLKDIIIAAKEDDSFVAVPTEQPHSASDIIDIKNTAEQKKEGGNLP